MWSATTLARRGDSAPRTHAPIRRRGSRQTGSSASGTWTCRYAWRNPSRARIASADTLFGDKPSSGATSVGESPSASVRQSTVRHRPGSVQYADHASFSCDRCRASSSAPLERRLGDRFAQLDPAALPAPPATPGSAASRRGTAAGRRPGRRPRARPPAPWRTSRPPGRRARRAASPTPPRSGAAARRAGGTGRRRRRGHPRGGRRAARRPAAPRRRSSSALSVARWYRK